MSEMGLDLSKEYPKPLAHDDVVRASDVVITMAAGSSSRICPGILFEDWVPDRCVGAKLETVREIRGKIHTKVKTLVSSLLTKETTLP